MIDIKEYIETRREYRLRAEYPGRKQIYIHGEVSLNEALEAFEKFGKPHIIQECIKKRKITVWERISGWSKLEKNLE